jgi:hypothetical protein
VSYLLERVGRLLDDADLALVVLAVGGWPGLNYVDYRLVGVAQKL